MTTTVTLKYFLAEAPPGQRRRRMEHPSWRDIEERIKALDAESNSDLSLVKEDSEELTIGGGNGRFVVSMLRSDGTNGSLLNQAAMQPEEAVELIVGGQPSIIPNKCIVDLPAALHVASAFVRNEAMDAFVWDWDQMPE